MYVLFGAMENANGRRREALAVAHDSNDLWDFLKELKKREGWGDGEGPYTYYSTEAVTFGDVSAERTDETDGECDDSGCIGVAVFDAGFDPPKGWTHVERCDTCQKFEDDEQAAKSISDRLSMWCVDCNGWSNGCGEYGHSWHVVIPVEDAIRADLKPFPEEL